MNPQFRFRLRLVPAMLGAVALVVAATARLIAASPERAADEQAIRAAAAAYQKAVEAGDEAAVASLWLADGDIIDAAGNRIAAPVAAAAPTSPDGAGSAGSGTVAPECRVSPTSIRFVGPDTAIEDGTLEIVPQTGAALAGRFSAVWVRHEGRWKLAAVREAASGPPMGAEALAELDWLVGDWLVVEDPDAPTEPGRPAIEVSARWNDERTFLTRELTSTVAPGEPPVRITQRIGWDPLAKSIHSWVFGSDGTHGEAIWTRDGQSWIAQARTVGPDGTQGSTVTTYTPVGQDRCLWRSVPTDVGGRQLPAVDLVMVRKPRPQGGTTGSQP